MRGDVLYLCLKDGRIQNRLLDITDDALPKNDTGPVSGFLSQLSQGNSAVNPAKRIVAEKDKRQSK